ncbi:Alcohol dehydrogenase 3, mitochondrial [Elsinoe australis]|uniref:Alcohol dehydrogenase 3, mitochondrial n=1 Tax=Elsinoe australis TaxID=40998 RepID=A0A2P8A3Y1_9PEZI|nr:Alcohol dehydrogenase 3, mitochondrial [Elsinoe australis]
MGVEDLPDTMKAVQVFNKPYQVRTVPVPKKLHGPDLLIKVAVASYCHTDSMVTAGIFPPPLPCTASHEGAGTIVAMGPDVPSEYKIGMRVIGGLPYHPCRVCEDCTTGPENQRQYCPTVERHNGVLGDGFFAEYALVDSWNTTPLPDKVTFEAAAPLACAGRTIWRGVDQTGLVSGQWIALVGSGGGLGHLGIQFAKARGLNVIGVDARDDGLELSKSSGADVVVDARKGKEEVAKQVQGVTGGKGADATVSISDHKDATAISCAITKMHGEVIQIAQPKEVIVPFHEFIFRDIRLRGSLLCSEQESRRMLAEVAANNIHTKVNIFKGLDSIHELMDVIHGGKTQGKAVIVIDEDQIKKEKELGAKV